METRKLPKLIFITILVYITLSSIHKLAYEFGLLYYSKDVIQINGIEEKTIKIETDNGGDDCLVVTLDDNKGEMDIEVIVREISSDSILHRRHYKSPWLKTHREMLDITSDIDEVSFSCTSKIPDTKVNIQIIRFGTSF